MSWAARDSNRGATTPAPPHGHVAAQNPGETTLQLEVPGQLIEQIAQRVAELLRDTHASIVGAGSPWLDFDAACIYLGFTPDTLYKLTAAGAIPCRKKAGGQGLRFHCEELDTWMDAAYPRLDRLR